MRYLKTLVAAGVATMINGQAIAAPTAAEAARLGKDLTPMGSERAANKEGTIPEWTGGLCKPPAGYKPRNGVSGAPHIDPFADEKPLFSVTAANMDKYADKLDDGQKQLLKLHPQTYRVDVYPSHRTACMPDWVYENTIKRVMSPKLVGDAPGLVDAHAQIPFPVPKDGREALYNHRTSFHPVNYAGDFETWLVDPSGNKVLLLRGHVDYRYEYWDNSKSQSGEIQSLLSIAKAPPSKVGYMDMRTQWARMDQKDPKAWSYTPGQRRVRLAPEFTYDTVNAPIGGVAVYDELAGFDGKMDRFDFKLVGKKELFIPYNAYKYMNTPLDQALTKSHLNPDQLRHELHRVWVIEATRKPDARHIYSKKVFYIDEDSWYVVSYQGYDDAGKLYRALWFPIWQAYELPGPMTHTQLAYDFNKNAWAAGLMPVGEGWRKSDPYPADYFTPDAMAARGVR